MKDLNCLKIFLLFIFLIAYTNSNAQISITGTILNKNKTPVEFANITLMDTVTNQLIAGTISDEKGHFKIEEKFSKDYQLSILFIGYESWTKNIAAKSMDFGEIILVESSNELGEIVVTAARPVIERKEDKLVFNIGNSPLKSGYDGIEVLQRAPYVWVDSDDNIQMRNQSPQILINGRPLNLQGNALSNYIKNLDSENIKSIEIQTNPSANSDANNLGGVINIILRKKPIGFNSTIRTDLETFGDAYYELYSGMNLNYGAAHWNMYGNYFFWRRDNMANVTTDITYKETDNYLRTDIIQEFDNSQHSYQLGFVIDPWKNHEFGGEFFGRHTNSFYSNESSFSLTNHSDIIDSGITNTANNRIVKINTGVLNYTWRMDTLNSSLKVIVDRTFQTNEENTSAYSIYDLNYFTDNQERNFFDNKTGIFSVQADLIKNLQNDLKLEFGAKYTNTDRKNQLLSEGFLDNNWLKNDRSTALNYQEAIAAAYGNISKKIKGKHYFKLGIRAENTDLNRVNLVTSNTITKNYTDWFPSAYYSYDLPRNGTISTSYSRRLRRPSFFELNNDIRKINDFRYGIGNPDLRPEYIDQYELEYQRKKQTFSIYYRQANDAINGIYFLENGIAYYQRQNNGAQKQFGVFYNASGKISEWWSFRGSIHFYNRKYTNDDGLDIFKKSTASLRVFNTFKINETTGFDVNGRYLSPHADAFYEQAEFYTVNFTLKKTFFNKKLDCRLRLDDVFNTARSSNTRPFPTIITTNYRKLRSRSLMLRLVYNFSNKNKASNRKNQSDSASRRRL